jgi:hypothetical protein
MDTSRPFTVIQPDLGESPFELGQRVRVAEDESDPMVTADPEGAHIVVSIERSVLNGIRPVLSFQIEPFEAE